MTANESNPFISLALPMTYSSLFPSESGTAGIILIGGLLLLVVAFFGFVAYASYHGLHWPMM